MIDNRTKLHSLVRSDCDSQLDGLEHSQNLRMLEVVVTWRIHLP
jgi:hypothetical protein